MQPLGNLSHRQVGLVEQYLDFDGQLLVNQLLRRPSVHILRGDLMKIARSDAQLFLIENHLVLLTAILPDKLHEFVEEHLLPVIPVFQHQFLLNRIEQPHQHSLQIVVFLLPPERRRAVVNNISAISIPSQKRLDVSIKTS